MTARSSSERPLRATGIPTRQAQGCVWASLPQPDNDVEQPQLIYKYDVSHKTRKYVTYHYAATGWKSHGATGDTHKNLMKIGRLVPKIWSRTDKHTDTHTQIHTLVTILRPPPIGGGVKNLKKWSTWWCRRGAVRRAAPTVRRSCTRWGSRARRQASRWALAMRCAGRRLSARRSRCSARSDADL